MNRPTPPLMARPYWLGFQGNDLDMQHAPSVSCHDAMEVTRARVTEDTPAPCTDLHLAAAQVDAAPQIKQPARMFRP